MNLGLQFIPCSWRRGSLALFRRIKNAGLLTIYYFDTFISSLARLHCSRMSHVVLQQRRTLCRPTSFTGQLSSLQDSLSSLQTIHQLTNKKVDCFHPRAASSWVDSFIGSRRLLAFSIIDIKKGIRVKAEGRISSPCLPFLLAVWSGSGLVWCELGRPAPVLPRRSVNNDA